MVDDASLASSRRRQMKARADVAFARAIIGSLPRASSAGDAAVDLTFACGKPVPGARFYHEVLPRIAGELDPERPYWPGSPFGGSDHNAREQGNVHNWEVWHGNYPRRFGEEARRGLDPDHVAFTRYAEDMGRFISEFGVLPRPTARRCGAGSPPTSCAITARRWTTTPRTTRRTRSTRCS